MFVIIHVHVVNLLLLIVHHVGYRSLCFGKKMHGFLDSTHGSNYRTALSMWELSGYN
jgi:hypothetical protein